MATEKAVITQSHLTDIANSIIAKGGATGPLKPSEMKAAIEAIPTGGDDLWKQPSYWPNIRDVYKNSISIEGLPYKIVMLCKNDNKTHYWFGGKTAVFQDGHQTSVTYNQYGAPSYKSTTSGYYWVIIYSDIPSFNLPIAMGNYILWVYADNDDVYVTVDTGDFRLIALECRYTGVINASSCGCRYIRSLDYTGSQVVYQAFNFIGRIDNLKFVYSGTNGNQAFYNTSLQEVSDAQIKLKSNDLFFAANRQLKCFSGILDTSDCTSLQYFFADCMVLERFDAEVDFSNITGSLGIFNNCRLLEALPDVMNLAKATTNNSLFQSCSSLKRLPTHLTINVSVNFSYTTAFTEKDSLATFAADGTVNGGMVGNLNTCTKADQTVTLNARIKALFTETEQTAIADCLTSKNWGLVW